MTITVTIRSESRWQVTGSAAAILVVRAAHDPGRIVRDESLVIEGAAHTLHDSPTGERPVRLRTTEGPVVVRYEATVDLAPAAPPPAPGPLPSLGEMDLALHPWTLPSRYCPSDLMAATAEHLVQHAPATGARLDLVCGWVREHIAYVPGASDTHTSAEQTLLRRAGVCRDLAHLTIALLRALDVPARMVAAYALDLEPQDFHAVVEAHDGTAWRLLDPTGLAPVDTLVRIATGRDAADVAWASASGGLVLEQLHVEVSRA